MDSKYTQRAGATQDFRGRLVHAVRAGITAILAFTCSGAIAANQPQQARQFRLAPWPQGVATPQIELTDLSGRTRTLASFRGSVVVVYFGFVSCPQLCPDTLLKLSRAMKELGPSRARVTVVFITLDPQHDSAHALQAYLKSFAPDFVGLTGSVTRVNAAAAAFHVQHAHVKQNGAETIDHSTGLYVLDTHGSLRVIGSTDAKAEDIAHDLRLLAAE